MTITLMQKEWGELWAEVAQNSLKNQAQPFEFLCEVPRQIGKGYKRNIEVHPRLWLSILDYEYHDDVLVKIPAWDHPLQFNVLLSGVVGDGEGQYVGEGYALISGSGVQRAMTVATRKSQRIVGVDIHLPPDILATFFPGEDGEIPSQLSLLAKGNDWQTLLYPETTIALTGVAQQIVNCPYQGLTKQMYLQAKVLELMALQLAPILADRGGLQPLPRLKAGTIARIHHAREVLLSRLENPPSLLELAFEVGVSERTLRKGFQELFGTTVFGYLTEQRMVQAEQLLQGGTMKVAEVASCMGYVNPSHFAAAFKRKFGIAPGECSVGKNLSYNRRSLRLILASSNYLHLVVDLLKVASIGQP